LNVLAVIEIYQKLNIIESYQMSVNQKNSSVILAQAAITPFQKIKIEDFVKIFIRFQK